MRSTAFSIGYSGSITAGDLPPNSKVTGVKFCAAAAMTLRPVAPEPVNIRWSNGNFENAIPTSPVSSKICNFSALKYLGLNSISNSAKCLEFSDILTIAVFPAANTADNCENIKLMGKFHGTIIPITPSGCGITRFFAPKYKL